MLDKKVSRQEHMRPWNWHLRGYWITGTGCGISDVRSYGIRGEVQRIRT